MKKIVIIGGGTAGWLTALYMKKYYTEYNITLLESTKLGILGAGEGGTPNLRGLLLGEFGLDESEFLTEVKGTKKYGILFDKWNIDPTHSFVHGFGLDALEDPTEYSYHFDARLFAKYLQKKAVEIGVNHLDNEAQIFLKTGSEISTIVCEDGTEVPVDFLIDCSGFRRLVIGQVYNSPWQSYEEHLKVNAAIPFFVNKPNQDPFQRTVAEAANYGWIWKIPLQHRSGCGYIYDSNLVEEDEIRSEILKAYPQEDIQFNPKIEFKAGCFKQVWIENCIAIGLSGGFLEPLEATSIMTTIFQLKFLPKDLFDYSKREQYNHLTERLNFQNMAFIRHHYNCSREDTIFWKEYRTRELLPELEDIYSEMKQPLASKTPLSSIFKLEKGVMKDYGISFGMTQYKHIQVHNFMKKQKTLI